MDQYGYVFGYGSLLAKQTVMRFLEGEKRRLIPVKLNGYKRGWNAHLDPERSTGKLYLDSNYQLVNNATWANLIPEDTTTVNGVCRPVSKRQFQNIKYREEGYQPVEVTQAVTPYPGFELDDKPIYTFIHPNNDNPTGQNLVVNKPYPEMVNNGVEFWDKIASGFQSDYDKSTYALDARKGDLNQIYFEPNGQDLMRLDEEQNQAIPIYGFTKPQFEPDAFATPTRLEPGRLYDQRLFPDEKNLTALSPTDVQNKSKESFLHSLILSDHYPDMVKNDHHWMGRSYTINKTSKEHWPLHNTTPAENEQAQELLSVSDQSIYHALSDYYVTQYHPYACSIAVATMLLNASDIPKPELFNENKRLFKQEQLLDDERTRQYITRDSLEEKGASLLDLQGVLEAFGLDVQYRPGPEMDADTFISTIDRAFNNKKYVVVNYDREPLGQGNLPHIVPAGAVSPSKQYTLLFDVSRYYWQRTWVSSKRLHSGAATRDSSGDFARGLLIVSST